MFSFEPRCHGLATIEQVTVSTGGSALNMAVVLRQLGATFGVGLLGALGGDENGAFILGEYARLDIDTTRVHKVAGVATAFTDAMVQRVGDRRTFFHTTGPTPCTTPRQPTSRSRVRRSPCGLPGAASAHGHPLARRWQWLVEAVREGASCRAAHEHGDGQPGARPRRRARRTLTAVPPAEASLAEADRVGYRATTTLDHAARG